MNDVTLLKCLGMIHSPTYDRMASYLLASSNFQINIMLYIYIIYFGLHLKLKVKVQQILSSMVCGNTHPCKAWWGLILLATGRWRSLNSQYNNLNQLLDADLSEQTQMQATNPCGLFCMLKGFPKLGLFQALHLKVNWKYKFILRYNETLSV